LNKTLVFKSAKRTILTAKCQEDRSKFPNTVQFCLSLKNETPHNLSALLCFVLLVSGKHIDDYSATKRKKSTVNLTFFHFWNLLIENVLLPEIIL